MNVFDTHAKIIADYSSYIKSFVTIADPTIEQAVSDELQRGKLWPEPLLQFNPAFEQVGAVEELAKRGLLHGQLANIFQGFTLFKHQYEAIQLGTSGRDFVVTSGTGSGKSLTYIGTIFHHMLENPSSEGVQAVVIYPMNALINSQTEEFTRYQKNYLEATGKDFPIRFGQYTGQEDEAARQRLRDEPPQILLTNFMMLELLLTRTHERKIRDAIYRNLRFFVFDELHTYRGRQGADVAMLIRRIRTRAQKNVTYIGTSATMVSGGSVQDQKDKVTQVASTLFGKPFHTDQIIDEKLSPSLQTTGAALSIEALHSAVTRDIDRDGDDVALSHHPVAIWLESEVALENRDGTWVRRKPMRIGEIVARLAEASNTSTEESYACLASMLMWISTVNQKRRAAGEHDALLPFKLHQFISQTGSVYTTLDQDENRTISLEPGLYELSEETQKPIFPNVFSRATGHAFICVTLAGAKLLPREFDDQIEEDDETQPTEDGYLIVGNDIWDPAEMESLPDAWFRTTRKGRFPEKRMAPRLPRRVFFDEYGNWSEKPVFKWSGWFMTRPLLFDPTGGVFFDHRTRENTKLTKLGSEGRSTSTTIMTFSILNRLREAGYPVKDQKLLSFTDNRQDAALQAGHFNDFLQVIRIRAAIRKAMEDAPDNTLDFAQIGDGVFRALALPFTEFSSSDTVPTLAPVRRRLEELFQKFLLYRILADLRRSWRIVLPNLEQCGLLAVRYRDLAEMAEAEEFWVELPLVKGMTAPERLEFLTDVLDFFRFSYALHSTNFLTESVMRDNSRHFVEKLRAPWTLEKEDELKVPAVARLDRLSRKVRLPNVSMGPTSGLGKYIKQVAKAHDFAANELKGEKYINFITTLMKKLVGEQFLEPVATKSESGDDTTAWRLKIDTVLWTLGSGDAVKVDPIKRRSYKAFASQPNPFFRDLYCQDLSTGKRLEAGDHTGQLSTALRREREDRFRAEWKLEDGKTWDEDKISREAISALYCSPTMELGVDIGGLSVVHMRNAPPNPANYAQRSGRAGRSGQGALVFTYCSSYSPHDRHYFQQQAELVAGSVQAPRLDLCNQELLNTHLNALAISEIGLAALESAEGQPASLVSLVERHKENMPLRPEVISSLVLSPSTLSSLRDMFGSVIADFRSELEKRASDWFSASWVEVQLKRLSDALDDSMGRWRKLHDSARALLSRATAQINSGTLVTKSREYKKAERLQKQALRQINLLENELGGYSTEISEFYPYRYLAAEAFLPGYNFTRLPIRIFLQDGSSGEFISRARSIALREFGPLNVIYHSGKKYRVEQLVVQEVESALTVAKVSKKAGYFLTGNELSLEICPFTGHNLSDTANAESLHDLVELAESRATEIDRISCEEEERVSRGFEISTYFSVDGAHMERVRSAMARADGSHLLNLRFIPSARLVHVSTKWRSQQLIGFPLGTTHGFWKASVPELKDPKQPPKEEYLPVKLWTSNTADALFMEPIQALGLKPDGVVTLQHAFKRATEAIFQVEPSEIGVVTIGDPQAPNILLFESSEGSLGILTQFVDHPGTFNAVVEKAIEICRYDDTTYLAPASYDDLLSYYNQRDHRLINRFAIKDALRKLKTCEVELQTNPAYQDYEAHYRAMRDALDPQSDLERIFIDYLYKNGLRLPDDAQMKVDGIYVQPDFFYKPDIHVFCDGSVHDRPEVREADLKKRRAIQAKGEEVWVYTYKDHLAEKVAQRPDIFKKVK